MGLIKKVKRHLRKKALVPLTRRAVNHSIKDIKLYNIRPARDVSELAEIMANPNISSDVKRLYFGEYCVRRAMKEK